MVGAAIKFDSRTSPDVLLVEDNALHARLVASMLTEAWPNFDTSRLVKSLEDAVREVTERPPECVLLDLVLPDADGLEAVGAVIAANPLVPIVVLSSYSDDALSAKAVRQGAQDYIVKGSVDAGQLARSIRHAIYRHGLWAERAGIEAPSTASQDPPGMTTARDDDRGVALLGSDRSIVFADHALGEMLGLPLDELVGRAADEFSHPDDRAAWDKVFRLAGEDPQPPATFDVGIAHGAGGTRRAEVELVPMYDADGEVAAFRACYRALVEEGTAASGGTHHVMSGWDI